MYEQELEKRTSGARSSLILIKGAALKVFAYQSIFLVEMWSPTRMIYVPKFVAVVVVIGPML